MVQVKQTINHTNIGLKEFLTELQKLNKQGFSGSLQIEVNQTQNWLFFFRSGCLSWLTGGSNWVDRMKRHLDLFFPDLEDNYSKSLISEADLAKPCMIFLQLVNRGLIERQRLAELMSSVAQEILFDLIQLVQINGNTLSCSILPNDPQGKFSLLLPVVEVIPTLKQTLQVWQKWQSEGLLKYSPNLFPEIQEPALLQNQSLSDTNKSIIPLIDGSESLRGLAVKSNLNLVKVTKSLLPLVNQRAIFLSPVAIPKKCDLPDKCDLPNHEGNNSVEVTPENELLVACVDDSPVVCQAVEKIIRSQGHRFLGIQDSLKALPLFLKNKPDIIFLDLVMPITNGYELCSQLRKTPSLKNVPVVILTGRDGLVDRMRAKMVGSNDFLSKPVEPDEFIKVLNKNLQIANN